MKIHSKKLISLMLAVVLVLGVFPMAGFAVEEGAVDQQIESSPSSLPEQQKEPEVVPDPEPEVVPEPEPEVVPEPEGTPSSLPETIDVEKLREELMKLTSQAELEAYMAALTQEEQEALAQRLTEADIRALAEQCGLVLEEEIFTPAKNYTNVGKLMPPVMVASSLRRMNNNVTSDDGDNGLELTKTAVSNGSGYTITLEAYTTGQVTSSEMSVPADVVLVLDESGSMTDTMYGYQKVYGPSTSNPYYVKSGNSYVEVKWCSEGGFIGAHAPGWYTGTHISILWGAISFHWGTRYEPMASAGDTTSGRVQFYTRSATSTQKMAALQAAATGFVQSVYDDATANDVDHRVAVVGFSNNNAASIKIGLKNDIRTQKTAVDEAIDGLDPDGATYIEDGMTKAKEAFDTAPAPVQSGPRNRVVVVFTDGIPGSGTWGDTAITNSANPAIVTSKTLKGSGYGATVYTIGLLDGADPELDITHSDLANSTDSIVRTNKFLHYLSSNFPNAVSMSNAGSGGGIGGGYYLSASDTDSLEAIFQNIAQEIATPAIPLGASTVIKDVVSPYFTAPADTDNINLYTAVYDGSDFGSRQGAPGVSAIISGDTVSVTGFNFDDNFVSDTGRGSPLFYGKKLIIEFTVSPKPGFLGGNAVPTNAGTSGVYKAGGELVEEFDVPEVNVPIPDIAVTAQDKNVYLLDSLTQTDLLAGATASAGVVPLDLTEIAYGLDEWQHKFVTITTELAPATFASLTANTSSTLTVTIAPNSSPALPVSEKGDAAQTKSNSANIKVNVFKPELTFKDSKVWYGDTAPANYSGNLVSELWKHGSTLSTDADVTMTGEKPTLSLIYTPKAEAIVSGKIATRADIPVAVAVKIGAEPVTTYTTFVHQSCDPACGWATPDGPGNPAFLLHVVTGTLTITKYFGEGDEPGPGESFLFTVTGPSGQFRAVIQGDSTATIIGLPVGDYTVTEDTSWSWRYGTPSQNWGTGGSTLGGDKVVIACEITNSNRTPYWLSGEHSVVNAFRLTA